MDHGPKVVVVAQSARDASHPPSSFRTRSYRLDAFENRIWCVLELILSRACVEIEDEVRGEVTEVTGEGRLDGALSPDPTHREQPR